MMAGIKFTHVPYRGEALALTDLIAGNAQVMIATTGSSLQYAKAGTLRALATTTDDPVIQLPGVPPLSKTLPGYQANAWNGLCAPKGIPAQIVTLLNKQANLALADPKIKEHIANLAVSRYPAHRRTIAELSRPILRNGPRWCNSPARTSIDPREISQHCADWNARQGPVQHQADRSRNTAVKSCVRVDIVQGSITSYERARAASALVAISRHLVAAENPSNGPIATFPHRSNPRLRLAEKSAAPLARVSDEPSATEKDCQNDVKRDRGHSKTPVNPPTKPR